MQNAVSLREQNTKPCIMNNIIYGQPLATHAVQLMSVWKKNSQLIFAFQQHILVPLHHDYFSLYFALFL